MEKNPKNSKSPKPPSGSDHKSQETETSPSPPPPNTAELENKPSWLIWAEKNSKPKVYHFPKPKPILTRFKKPGPMTPEDIERFKKWVAEKAKPKRRFPSIPRTAPRKKKPLCQLMKLMNILSTPKDPRKKYKPPNNKYPYSPKIHYKKPAHHDKGRPFKTIRIPPNWPHEELEYRFWRSLRFPVRPEALKYHYTQRIAELALPKRYPSKSHCVWIEKVEYPPDRVKMTPQQWRAHLRHLIYLADSSFKDTRHLKIKL